MVLAIGLGLICITVILYILTVNRLVDLRNKVDRAWADIDVLLERRHDEIPALIEICKGHMSHECEVFSRLAAGRREYSQSTAIVGKLAAENNVVRGLRDLLALSENYPELRANQSFAHLTFRLSSLEDQISDRREFFNDAVCLYNTRIGQFPISLVASIQERKPLPSWDASGTFKKARRADTGW
ncbi:MAG: LemA family protein [Bacillota bacterium]